MAISEEKATQSETVLEVNNMSKPAFNGAPEGPADAEGYNQSVLDTPVTPKTPSPSNKGGNPNRYTDPTDHSDSGELAKRHKARVKESEKK